MRPGGRCPKPSHCLALVMGQVEGGPIKYGVACLNGVDRQGQVGFRSGSTPALQSSNKLPCAPFSDINIVTVGPCFRVPLAQIYWVALLDRCNTSYSRFT